MFWQILLTIKAVWCAMNQMTMHISSSRTIFHLKIAFVILDIIEVTMENLWKKLDDLDVSKVFILFNAKRTKKNPDLEVIIQSIIVTTKTEKNTIPWDNDVYSFDSDFTKPIREQCADLSGKMDGMLVYNNVSKNLSLNATVTKKVKEKIKRIL